MNENQSMSLRTRINNFAKINKVFRLSGARSGRKNDGKQKSRDELVHDGAFCHGPTFSDNCLFAGNRLDIMGTGFLKVVPATETATVL